MITIRECINVAEWYSVNAEPSSERVYHLETAKILRKVEVEQKAHDLLTKSLGMKNDRSI